MLYIIRGIVKYDIERKTIIEVVPLEGRRKAVALYGQGIAYFSNQNALYEIPDSSKREGTYFLSSLRKHHPLTSSSHL